jgi:hypothetical protein
MKTLIVVFLLIALGSAQQSDPAASSAQGSEPDQKQDSARANSAIGIRFPESRVSENTLRLSFEGVETVDTNPSGLAGDLGTDFISTLGGTLALDRSGRRNRVSLSYTGGGEIFARNTDLSSTFHHLGFDDTIRGRRWQWSLMDEARYTPAAAFAFTPAGTQNSTGLSPSVVPSQTILGPRVHQFSNTVATELDLAPSSRQNLTFTGAYGILRFFQSDLLDGEQASFSGGYSYRVNPRNEIGAVYGYGYFQYDVFNTTVTTQSIMGAYSRSLGRRFEMVLRGGPERAYSDLTNVSTDIAGLASLRYFSPLYRVDLSYNRGVTAGSGVTAGAHTDAITFSLARTGRRWETIVSGGAALNTATQTANLLQPNRIRNSYGSGFGSIQVNKTISRSRRMFLRYSLQRLSPNVCLSTGCTTNSIRQLGDVGLDWAFRPVRVF